MVHKLQKLTRKKKLQSFGFAKVRPLCASDLKKKTGSNGKIAIDWPSKRDETVETIEAKHKPVANIDGIFS